MFDRTMNLSSERERTRVTEIGLKSVGCIGFVTFGMGVITAVFHWCGAKPSVID